MCSSIILEDLAFIASNFRYNLSFFFHILAKTDQNLFWEQLLLAKIRISTSFFFFFFVKETKFLDFCEGTCHDNDDIEAKQWVCCRGQWYVVTFICYQCLQETIKINIVGVGHFGLEKTDSSHED